MYKWIFHDVLPNRTAIAVPQERCGHNTMLLLMFTTLHNTVTHATSNSPTTDGALISYDLGRDVKANPAEHNDCKFSCTTDADATGGNVRGTSI